jgi:hypothetical protein
MVHMASSQRSCGSEAKDEHVNTMGCIRLFYLYFPVFVILGHKGHFSLLVRPINKTNQDWWLIATSHTFNFAVLRFRVVRQDLNFVSQIIKLGMEAVISVIGCEYC